MNFFQGFSKGIKAYGKAARLLFSGHFSYFLLFPVFIIVVLFIAGNYAVSCIGGGLSETVEQQIMEWISGISWLSWLSGTVGFIVRLLVRALYYILFISFGGYVVMVVMSPVYSWLSERTEAHLSGKEYPFNFGQLMWEIGRGIVISLRCMIFQFILTVILFFLSFIPLVGLVTPVLTFGVSAYFYGFAFMDYAVERKRFRVKESVRYMRHNAGMVVAIGTVFTLALMIPFIRVIVCCFVSLLSVIAGTVVVDESLNKKNER
ncbi:MULTISPECIES: EI24 domain-containing protein [Butyricimonas]|uniref:EI24 domain-containing protein n=1 Tax=Butyricimonas TaxID=574697 RepID=UPI0007FB1EF8|nr:MULTISPECIES: EI24 domain-containing protein [Butyricimonas]